MLWGQADTGLPSGNVVAYVFGQLGTVAALVWYLWYVTSRELPRSRQDFLEAINAQRTEYARLIQAEREEMRAIGEALHQLAMAMQDLSESVRVALDISRARKPTPPPPTPP